MAEIVPPNVPSLRLDDVYVSIRMYPKVYRVLCDSPRQRKDSPLQHLIYKQKHFITILIRMHHMILTGNYRLKLHITCEMCPLDILES